MKAEALIADRIGIGQEWINRASLSGLVLVLGSIAVFQKQGASGNDISAIFGIVLLGVGLLGVGLLGVGLLGVGFRWTGRSAGPRSPSRPCS